MIHWILFDNVARGLISWQKKKRSDWCIYKEILKRWVLLNSIRAENEVSAFVISVNERDSTWQPTNE